MWRSEPAVGITWEDGKTTRETTGTVVLALPRPDRPEDPPDRWAFPDIALLRVPGTQKASCVRLSERPAVWPAAVSLHGWSRETGELGIRHVHGTLNGSDGQALVTRGVMPVEGCSGGPVVDHAQGAVVGLNKGRGADGGAVVPVTALRALHDLPGGEAMGEALRAHDRYHLARYRSLDDRPDWTRAQLLLPGTQGAGPGLRTQLHGHFAELPAPTAPGEIMNLIDQVKAWIRDDSLPDALEDDPRTWSEGAGLLRGLRAPAATRRATSTWTPCSCTRPTSSGTSPGDTASGPTRRASPAGSSTSRATPTATSGARSTGSSPPAGPPRSPYANHARVPTSSWRSTPPLRPALSVAGQAAPRRAHGQPAALRRPRRRARQAPGDPA